MRRAPIAAAALASLLAACGGEPTEVASSPTEAASDPADSSREHLDRPDLDALDERVRSQVEQELAELDPLIADPATPPAELAERLGRLARIYHAYELLGPAETAYRRTEQLAPEDPRWPYLRAVVAQARGEIELAERLLRRALELSPGDLPALLRLAELHLLADRNEEAGELFEQALEQEPDSAAAHHGLARIATARGDHQEAALRLQRVLELQPEASTVHLLLAQAYRRLGDREAAERHVARRGAMPVAVEDPLVDGLQELLRGIGIHLERGLRAFNDGRNEEAIAEYRAALELEPEHPTALRRLALNLAIVDRHDEALRTYEHLLEVHPDDRLALLDHATVLLELGRVEEAIPKLRSALQVDPDFKAAHFNLGTAYSRIDRWAEAAESFRQVLRLDRDELRARYSLAVALDELQRPAEAAAELERVVAADPRDLRARQRLGSLLERLGRPADALEQFRAVLGLEAPDEELALAHYQIGRMLGALDRDDEAYDSFRRAGELFPSFWQARFAQANWLSRHDRHAEAAVIFGRLAVADPSNVLARQREAAALMSAGSFRVAKQRLEQGLEEHPRSYELASLLARLLATAPDASLRDGRRALELAQELIQAQRSIDQAETVAMALAELERFEEAAAFQRQIVDWAESEGQSELAERLRRNLERYERRQPVRQLPG